MKLKQSKVEQTGLELKANNKKIISWQIDKSNIKKHKAQTENWMLNETKMSKMDNSFSERLRFQQSQSSESSEDIRPIKNGWNTRQIISSRQERWSKQSGQVSNNNEELSKVRNRQESRRELPIMSNEKIHAQRLFDEDSTDRQIVDNSNIYNQVYVVDRKHRDTQAITTPYSLNRETSTHQPQHINMQDYRNLYIPNTYIPYNNLNHNNSMNHNSPNPIYTSNNKAVNQSTQQSTGVNNNTKRTPAMNSPRIQRRHNVSSRKSISSNVNLSQVQVRQVQVRANHNVSNVRSPSGLLSPNSNHNNNYEVSTLSKSRPSMRPSNLSGDNSLLYNFVQNPSQNTYIQQQQPPPNSYISQRQLQLTQKQLYLQQQFMLLQQQQHHQTIQQQQQQQQRLNQIKTFSSISHIPYYQKHVQYMPEVIMVPKQKVIQKHYTIQNLIDYVPKVQQSVQGYDLIPHQVINYKLQYQLVQKRIVHLPNDKKWLECGIKIKRRQRERENNFVVQSANIHDKRSKTKNNKRNNYLMVNQTGDIRRVASPDGFIDGNYYPDSNRTSIDPRTHSLNSKPINRISSFGQRIPYQATNNNLNQTNIYNTIKTAINPFQLQQTPHHSPQTLISPQNSPNQSSPYFPTPSPSIISQPKPATYLYPQKQDLYDSMVNYYTNMPQTKRNLTNSKQNKDLATQNIKRRHKQTFHVTSETTTTLNDQEIDEE